MKRAKYPSRFDEEDPLPGDSMPEPSRPPPASSPPQADLTHQQIKEMMATARSQIMARKDEIEQSVRPLNKWSVSNRFKGEKMKKEAWKKHSVGGRFPYPQWKMFFVWKKYSQWKNDVFREVKYLTRKIVGLGLGFKGLDLGFKGLGLGRGGLGLELSGIGLGLGLGLEWWGLDLGLGSWIMRPRLHHWYLSVIQLSPCQLDQASESWTTILTQSQHKWKWTLMHGNCSVIYDSWKSYFKLVLWTSTFTWHG